MTRNEMSFEILKLFLSDLKWRPNAVIELEGEEGRKASEILSEDAVAYADALLELLND